jgi:hypothetical protein
MPGCPKTASATKLQNACSGQTALRTRKTSGLGSCWARAISCWKDFNKPSSRISKPLKTSSQQYSTSAPLRDAIGRVPALFNPIQINLFTFCNGLHSGDMTDAPYPRCPFCGMPVQFRRIPPSAHSRRYRPSTALAAGWCLTFRRKRKFRK